MLTDEQLYALLTDRLDGTGPCQVQENVPIAALAGSDVLHNARILMAELANGGGRLTATGNLTRKFVATLMERFRCDPQDLAAIREVCKVVNESDFLPAQYLHALFRIAGLGRKRKATLGLTRLGHELMPEAQAGRLHALLFRTAFARYNRVRRDGDRIAEVLGSQTGLILYLIGRRCANWQSAEDVMYASVLPARELVELLSDSSLPDLEFEFGVLRYLCWFGLMEQRPQPDDAGWDEPSFYRKTGLFDRMLRFTFTGLPAYRAV